MTLLLYCHSGSKVKVSSSSYWVKRELSSSATALSTFLWQNLITWQTEAEHYIYSVSIFMLNEISILGFITMIDELNSAHSNLVRLWVRQRGIPFKVITQMDVGLSLRQWTFLEIFVSSLYFSSARQCYCGPCHCTESTIHLIF